MHQSHYYGDKVRSLLVTVGIIMLLTMPFFEDLTPKPQFFSILAILALTLLSGLINPRQKNIVALSTLVAAGAFLAFEYYAIEASKLLGPTSAFFLLNQILALICLIATYFGTKSVRGLSIKN